MILDIMELEMRKETIEERLEMVRRLHCQALIGFSLPPSSIAMS
jgi:hypothetical protein